MSKIHLLGSSVKLYHIEQAKVNLPFSVARKRFHCVSTSKKTLFMGLNDDTVKTLKNWPFWRDNKTFTLSTVSILWSLHWFCLQQSSQFFSHIFRYWLEIVSSYWYFTCGMIVFRFKPFKGGGFKIGIVSEIINICVNG